MPLLVLDPKLMVVAFVSADSDAGKLMALLAYGRTCAFAHEAASLDPDEGRQRGVPLQALRKEAHERAELMKSELPDDAPDDLLLATSTALTQEVVEHAQRLQRAVEFVRADVLTRQLNAHVWRFVTDLGASRSPHPADNLAQTAASAGADFIIVDRDQPEFDSPVPVRLLPEYVESDLLPRFAFDQVDASRVLHIAVRAADHEVA